MLSMLDDKTGESLVKSIVLSDFYYHSMKDIETDDLIGEGFLGLARAVKQYDPSRSGFSTFAYKKIKHAVIEYLRLDRTKNALGLISLEDYDRCYNPDTKIENADFVEQLMNCLTREEKKIVHRTYWQDESERKIAKVLKVSKTHVHLTKTYAIQKMRDRGNYLLNHGIRM